MAKPIWYLGPDGDMRAIVCPEKDLDITVTRYGGVFQGLTGARSVDVTGFRQAMTFNLKYLTADEYAWLEALHSRFIPGPFRLLNPFKKNRLTPEASVARWGGGTSQGIYLGSGAPTLVYDWPSAAGTVGAVTTKWSGRIANSPFRADQNKRAVVLPGETVVGSVWLKGGASMTVNVVIDWFDRTSQLTTALFAASVTTSWQRFFVTATAPAGAVTGRFAGYTSNTANDLFIGPMQFETGSTPTSWEQGGGAPQVVIDQMVTTSPIFPTRDVQLTLLEV